MTDGYDTHWGANGCAEVNKLPPEAIEPDRVDEIREKHEAGDWYIPYDNEAIGDLLSHITDLQRQVDVQTNMSSGLANELEGETEDSVDLTMWLLWRRLCKKYGAERIEEWLNAIALVGTKAASMGMGISVAEAAAALMALSVKMKEPTPPPNVRFKERRPFSSATPVTGTEGE